MSRSTPLLECFNLNIYFTFQWLVWCIGRRDMKAEYSEGWTGMFWIELLEKNVEEQLDIQKHKLFRKNNLGRSLLLERWHIVTNALHYSQWITEFEHLDVLSSRDRGRMRASYVGHVARWSEPEEIHCVAMTIKDRKNSNLYMGGTTWKIADSYGGRLPRIKLNGFTSCQCWYTFKRS